jgi:cyclin H
MLLVKLYISKITQLCGHFRFPEEVEATAVTYLKRFYLKNTVMDWHPKNVMYVRFRFRSSCSGLTCARNRLTALFLATKTTNNPIALEAYTSHIPKTSASDVLELEFLVAQSLGFEFAVWHAHRALWGIWLDLQVLPSPSHFASTTHRSDFTQSLPDSPVDRPQALYDTALSHVRASRLTDAELIYTPAQIALACLSLPSPSLASEWAASKDLSRSISALEKTIESIKSLIITSGHPPLVDSVREVDRRLKLCKNPEKVVGSKAYLARKAEEEKIAEEKRNRKAEEARRVMEDGDPFGDELSDKAKEQLVNYDDDDDDD